MRRVQHTSGLYWTAFRGRCGWGGLNDDLLLVSIIGLDLGTLFIFKKNRVTGLFSILLYSLFSDIPGLKLSLQVLVY